MCYRKKKRLNPIKPENRTGFDKYCIKTPCCTCPSCRKQRANGWLVRAFFEFCGNDRQAFFLSLDFDNEHLPTYKGQACFDSEIMKKFLKRLRSYIGKFRYFYATDFGGFLKRPHYHLICLPENSFSTEDFFSLVKKSWQQGHYTNVECIDSVQHNRLKALQYVTSYATKDITFDLDQTFKDLPMRYRPRTQASKGFGARALEEGIISPETLLNQESVSLPIGQNGKLVKFPIPRYYELKWCYERHYDVKTRITKLTKNELGVQLAKIRHNTDYVHFIKSLVASRWSDIDKMEFYSDYFSRPWRQVVSDCFEDFEDFKEFVYYRPFIRRSSSSHRYATTLTGDDEFYRPNWNYYDRICTWYEKYKSELDEVKCKLETEKLIQYAKIRARKKLERDPNKVLYLRRKNFDFSLLN